MAARRTETALWTGLVIAAMGGVAAKIQEFAHPGTPLTNFGNHGYEPFYLIANAVAVYFCLKIASDHHQRSTMRVAWLLMVASCAMAIVRHAFEWTALLLGWHETERLVSLVSLRQIPTVLAMVLLTAGLATMWSSFAAVGLGVRFRWRDAVLPTLVVGLMAAGLSERQEMWDDRSVYPFMRYLQWSSPVTIALPALIGLALQRTLQEMRGGQFADFLRYLVWSLLLRLASLQITFSPSLKAISFLAAAGAAAFWAAPWLFAMAVVRRWRITESLDQLADIYARNPEEGFATLQSAQNLETDISGLKH
jgi:hypothetical protein